MATTPALKPFKEMFDAALKTYRTHFKTVAGVSAVVAVVYIAAALLAPDPKTFSDPSQAIDASQLLAPALLVVVYVLVSIWSTIAMLLLAHDHSKHVGVSALLGAASKYFWPVLWATIIGGILTILGLIALVIPGIIVAIWFTFVTQVVVFEKKRGFAALEQSRAHVRGRWWAIFGRYLLLALIVIAAMMVFSFVALVFTAFLPKGIQQMFTDLFSIFVAAPIATFFTYELYKSASAAHHKPLPS